MSYPGFRLHQQHHNNKINKDLNAYVNSVIKEKGYHINDNILKINQSYITISKNIKNQNIVNNKIRSHYNKLISFLRNNNDSLFQKDYRHICCHFLYGFGYYGNYK